MYLKGTTKLDLWYTITWKIELEGYIYNDWVGCIDDNKGTSGYGFSIGTRAIR